MKRKITSLLLLIVTFNTWAQTIITPTYSRRDNISFRIDEIEKTSSYTIIKGVYENVTNYGWANINNTTYLKDCRTGKRIGTIIKSEGLPLSPNKHQFTKENEIVSFKLYFPVIENEVEMIDMIEDEMSASSFNYYGIALRKNIKRDFSVKYNPGHKLSSQPPLKARINGIKEIQVYVPSNLTDLDKYIFGNFVVYLQGLGIKVDVVPARYENSDTQVGTVYGQYRIFKENVGDYLKDSNTLGAVLNYVCTSGRYLGGTSINITFVDYINEYIWNVPQFELPTKAEKYINKLKKSVTDGYSYNSQYSFIPPSTTSTWNESILREYLTNNTSNPLEGIYKGDKYTVGVKKGNDGKYYMLYLVGADNLEDWKEGDVKAILTSTATPTLFKADWYGKWKQYIDYTISFVNGAFVATDPDKEQETYIKMFPDAQTLVQNSISSGTGFFIDKNGYIITNYHCVENAKSIQISGVKGDTNKKYKATIEITDKQNDLAILKITDASFTPLASIPYSFKFTTSNVGEDCFVLGYPLINTMGKDIKLTNGVISSKSGYDGNVAQYQISAPVQPGNSGGPVFDKSGNVIGIVQAKHTQAENAGYAIKANYIRNLVELLPTPINLPTANQLAGKALPQQVELASKAICIVIINDD